MPGPGAVPSFRLVVAMGETGFKEVSGRLQAIGQFLVLAPGEHQNLFAPGSPAILLVFEVAVETSLVAANKVGGLGRRFRRGAGPEKREQGQSPYKKKR